MKAVRSTTLTGGADGPTSVFIVGKKDHKKHIFQRIKNRCRQRRYRHKRQKAERMIKPGAHSLSETVRYMKNDFDAKEADSSYPHYEERRLQMKCSLLQHEKPELLGPQPEFLPPEDLNDKESVRKWMIKIEEWQKGYEKKAEKLPKEVFPTDYHLYYIDKGSDGKIEIETDHIHQTLLCSWSGNKEKMSSIVKDIYLYYGVTKEDIADKTARYQMLVTELAT